MSDSAEISRFASGRVANKDYHSSYVVVYTYKSMLCKVIDKIREDYPAFTHRSQKAQRAFENHWHLRGSEHRLRNRRPSSVDGCFRARGRGRRGMFKIIKLSR